MTSTVPYGITVVIPTFNRRNPLLAAVESVITRDPSRTEIVVVDDCSNENPARFLPSANASGVKVRLYRQVRNGGAQAARNLGIRRATYSHIAFLDSDDRFMPEKIDAILAGAMDGTDILFHAVVGAETYARLASWWFRIFPASTFGLLLMLLNPAPTPGLVIRRQRRLGPPSMRHCEDYAFLVRYWSKGATARFSPLPLSAVNRGIGTEGGLSARVWSMRKGEFLARHLLFKHAGPRAFPLVCIGDFVGCMRVLKDVLTVRYWR